jgi:hypothetical protein
LVFIMRAALLSERFSNDDRWQTVDIVTRGTPNKRLATYFNLRHHSDFVRTVYECAANSALALGIPKAYVLWKKRAIDSFVAHFRPEEDRAELLMRVAEAILFPVFISDAGLLTSFEAMFKLVVVKLHDTVPFQVDGDASMHVKLVRMWLKRQFPGKGLSHTEVFNFLVESLKRGVDPETEMAIARVEKRARIGSSFKACCQGKDNEADTTWHERVNQDQPILPQIVKLKMHADKLVDSSYFDKKRWLKPCKLDVMGNFFRKEVLLCSDTITSDAFTTRQLEEHVAYACQQAVIASLHDERRVDTKSSREWLKKPINAIMTLIGFSMLEKRAKHLREQLGKTPEPSASDLEKTREMEHMAEVIRKNIARIVPAYIFDVYRNSIEEVTMRVMEEKGVETWQRNARKEPV